MSMHFIGSTSFSQCSQWQLRLETLLSAYGEKKIQNFNNMRVVCAGVVIHIIAYHIRIFWTCATMVLFSPWRYIRNHDMFFKISHTGIWPDGRHANSVQRAAHLLGFHLACVPKFPTGRPVLSESHIKASLSPWLKNVVGSTMSEVNASRAVDFSRICSLKMYSLCASMGTKTPILLSGCCRSCLCFFSQEQGRNQIVYAVSRCCWLRKAMCCQFVLPMSVTMLLHCKNAGLGQSVCPSFWQGIYESQLVSRALNNEYFVYYAPQADGRVQITWAQPSGSKKWRNLRPRRWGRHPCETDTSAANRLSSRWKRQTLRIPSQSLSAERQNHRRHLLGSSKRIGAFPYF